MSILTIALGVDQQFNFQLFQKVKEVKQQEVEGRLIRVVLIAMAFALGAFYAVENIQRSASVSDSKVRVYPAPLL